MIKFLVNFNKQIYLTITCILILVAGCDKMPGKPETPFNPFDPNNLQTGGDPFNLTAKIAGGGITLEWNKPDIEVLQSYKIYRSEKETTGYLELGTASADQTQYIDKQIENGHSYWYLVTGVDIKDNESSRTNTAAVNINTDPLIVINGGEEYTPSREVSLTILAASAEQMMLSNSSDFAGANWETYDTEKNWILFKGGGQKTVFMKIKYDSTESTVVQTSILPRPMNPEIAIMADTTQYTKTRDLQISLYETGPNLQVKLGEDSTFAGINWQAYSSTLNFQLSDGDGAKIVFAKFLNDFEIESMIVNDGIIMDTTPPTAALSVTPDSGITNETTFTFDPAGCNDNYAPVQELQIRFDYENDGAYDTDWSPISVVNYTFTVGGGDKTVKMQLTDGAWQVDTMVTIFVNTPPQAAFTAIEDEKNLKLWHFDASGSWDYEDGENLQYRWDFDGDNNWDTGWLTQDTISYEFTVDGDYLVKVSIRDLYNISSYVSRNITVDAIVADIDDNIYKIIKIGNQYWMVENLKVTHYSNGDSIPNIKDDSEWPNLNIGAYCSYENNESYTKIYGLLYNWYTVQDGRTIAPEGWHVPTDDEWKILINFLGSDAGYKLKSTTGWNSGGNGDDSYGFSAFPIGYRRFDATFQPMGLHAHYWTGTEAVNFAVLRRLNYDNSDIDLFSNEKRQGFSIRCVRD